MPTGATLVALLTSILVNAAGQSSGPVAFDVASIKENPSEESGGTIRPFANGRWQATNIPARSLISHAWNVPTFQVLGGPDWIGVTRYDITAVGPENATRAQVLAMVRALLVDRFKVRAHLEQRELPTYNLVLARIDGRFGPGLRLSPIRDCFDRAAIVAMSPPPRPCMMTFGPGTLTGTMTLANLAVTLTGASGRPVFDRTALAGNYEIDLKWTSTLGGDNGDAVSIFTALQEQLGLKLESATAPLDVLIVDGVERPTPN